MLKFYGRRAMRLYPVVFVYTFFVVAAYLFLGMDINWPEPLSVIFYFANYFYAPMPRQGGVGTMPFEPLWSLAVEEHFYFLLPAAMLFLRRRPRELLASMIVICVLCLVYRIVMAMLHPELLDTRFFYFRTEARIDSLAYGVALAAMCEMPEWRGRLLKIASPITLVIAGLVVLGTLVWRDPFFRETIRYSIQGCAIAAAVVSILFRPGWVQYILNTSPFMFVGYISYSLYVWSICTHDVVRYVARLSGWVEVLALFLVAFAMACASYFLLEKPLQSLRQRMGSVALGRQ
ncbi:peptidoglycan/LPS O-acetylase OafA/YrhL [Phenylobacterium koreense]|uniref:Peptidoglycan/LPS O-acetylase OafA/YrhL n=1 Tax=Phenylobacterium koreense TaxID=266125 RepID=A0ABV2EM52_9CAUL